jgi:membrane protein YdbS with pleckstrin-like domain
MTDAHGAPLDDALHGDVRLVDSPRDDARLGLADAAPRCLAPRVQLWWRIGFLLNAVVPSLLLGALAWFAVFARSVPHAVAAAALPWLVAILVAVRIPGRRYAAWRYRLTPDALRLDRGVMFRVESVVPYTRIQHVDTEQGPLERLLGLSHVTVHTASGSGSSLTIPGLVPDDGHALREHLAMLAGVVEPL